VTARKTTKKTAAKKTTRKAPAKKTFKFSRTTRPRSKSDIMSNIAENTELTKKEVTGVFDTLAAMLGHDLQKSGPQIFSLAGLAKFTVQRKPATKARKGINPFTGEEAMFKAKPARNVVKIRPLKALKDMV
jgi:nucleoid DNA-binding protein